MDSLYRKPSPATASASSSSSSSSSSPLSSPAVSVGHSHTTFASSALNNNKTGSVNTLTGTTTTATASSFTSSETSRAGSVSHSHDPYNYLYPSQAGSSVNLKPASDSDLTDSSSRQLHSTRNYSVATPPRSATPTPTAVTAATNQLPLQPPEPNRCYICFGTDEDSAGRWVKPCQCTLISHEDCLLDWIDKNRQQFPKKQVRCSVCRTVYRLSEPTSLLLTLYYNFDSLVHAGIPYLTFLGLTCSVLITSTTYGAYAVLTVCGTEEGERLLGSPNPWGWRVWTGLPLIPVILIFSRTKLLDSFMPLIPLLIVGNDQLQVTFPPSPALTISVMPWIRMAYHGMWSDFANRLEMRWRKNQISGMGVGGLGVNASLDADTEPSTAGGGNVNNSENGQDEDDVSFFDRKDTGRMIVGALLMPAISSVCGSILGHFPFIRARIPDNFHRNILGGCLFVVIKDLAGLVGKYQELRRRRVRRVREYSEFKDER